MVNIVLQSININTVIKNHSLFNRPNKSTYLEKIYQKLDRNTEGKRLIKGTYRHKDTQLKAWNPLAIYPSWEYTFDIREWNGNVFDPLLAKKA